MNRIKLWWKTQVLRQVVYKPSGRPYDCKGLQFKGSKPFGEDVQYYITRAWRKYTYLGKGKYTNWRAFHSDRLNPYYREAVIKAKEDFNKRFNITVDTIK